MGARRFERECALVDSCRIDDDFAAYRSGYRRGDFIDADDQRAVAPVQRTGSDGQRIRRLTETGPPPLGHRPAGAARAIQRDIDRTMTIGIGPVRPGVIGRENAADEGDDRERIGAVVAQRVDIPPAIAAWRNGRIERRSAIARRAALRPEIAAIGAPGPGCALPPAR